MPINLHYYSVCSKCPPSACTYALSRANVLVFYFTCNHGLRQGPQCPREGEIRGSEPTGRSDVAYCQITLAVVIN